MLITAIESRFFLQEFKDTTFTLSTGLPLAKKCSKTLGKPLCIPNASYPESVVSETKSTEFKADSTPSSIEFTTSVSIASEVDSV